MSRAKDYPRIVHLLELLLHGGLRLLDAEEEEDEGDGDGGEGEVQVEQPAPLAGGSKGASDGRTDC